MAVSFLPYQEKFAKNKEILLKIKVLPQAGRTEFLKILGDGTLKIAVKASPEEGRANRELIRFLATEFGVSKDEVHLLRGLSQRLKFIKIEAIA